MVETRRDKIPVTESNKDAETLEEDEVFSEPSFVAPEGFELENPQNLTEENPVKSCQQSPGNPNSQSGTNDETQTGSDPPEVQNLKPPSNMKEMCLIIDGFLKSQNITGKIIDYAGSNAESCFSCQKKWSQTPKEASLECGLCSNWFHKKCAGLTTAEFNVFKSEKDYSWLCLDCNKQLKGIKIMKRLKKNAFLGVIDEFEEKTVAPQQYNYNHNKDDTQRLDSVENVIIEMKQDIQNLTKAVEKSGQIRARQTNSAHDKPTMDTENKTELIILNDKKQKPQKIRKRYDLKKICPEYRVGHTCPGRKDCPQGDHPIKCLNIMKRGVCRESGQCPFWHPPLCEQSERNRICVIRECPKWHVQNTKKPNDEKKSNGQRRTEGVRGMFRNSARRYENQNQRLSKYNFNANEYYSGKNNGNQYSEYYSGSKQEYPGNRRYGYDYKWNEYQESHFLEMENLKSLLWQEQRKNNMLQEKMIWSPQNQEWKNQNANQVREIPNPPEAWHQPNQAMPTEYQNYAQNWRK